MTRLIFVFFLMLPYVAFPSEVLKAVDENFVKKKPEFIWGRDPFLKTPGHAMSTEAKSDPMKLEAIIYDQDDPAAMVNGQIVHKGSTLKGGQQISEIGPNYVLVESPDGSLNELLLNEAPRAPASTGKNQNEKSILDKLNVHF